MKDEGFINVVVIFIILAILYLGALVGSAMGIFMADYLWEQIIYFILFVLWFGFGCFTAGVFAGFDVGD